MCLRELIVIDLVDMLIHYSLDYPDIRLAGHSVLPDADNSRPSGQGYELRSGAHGTGISGERLSAEDKLK